MGQLVVSGAMLSCSFGAAPSSMIVLPTGRTNGVKMPAATIMDYTPMKNIMPFGMCSSMANPQVAAATSAAQGVLTPQPCIPSIPAPWTPGSPTVSIGNLLALNNSSMATCMWAGVISISNAGQATVNVP